MSVLFSLQNQAFMVTGILSANGENLGVGLRAKGMIRLLRRREIFRCDLAGVMSQRTRDQEELG